MERWRGMCTYLFHRLMLVFYHYYSSWWILRVRIWWFRCGFYFVSSFFARISFRFCFQIFSDFFFTKIVAKENNKKEETLLIPFLIPWKSPKKCVSLSLGFFFLFFGVKEIDEFLEFLIEFSGGFFFFCFPSSSNCSLC